MTIEFEEPVLDRSRYAEVFAQLHDPTNWNQWAYIDTVSGGGLASRLRDGHYRGMQDLEFEVRTNRVEKGLRVYVRVSGRRPKG